MLWTETNRRKHELAERDARTVDASFGWTQLVRQAEAAGCTSKSAIIAWLRANGQRVTARIAAQIPGWMAQ